MNVKLLREIKQQILKEPKLYDQDHVTVRKECGTAHCIAGWAMMLSRSISSFPGASLDITTEQYSRLAGRAMMGTCDWPKKYAEAYKKARTPQGRARVAAQRIDCFIKTKGRL